MIYTTSATINYLLHKEKASVREIRDTLNEPLRIFNRLRDGKQLFTKQHYLNIIKKYPHLEGHVEMFENVKLKDK